MAEERCFLPATELAERIASGDLSPVEVVDAYLDRIERRNDVVNAYVTITGDRARRAAREAARAVSRGDDLGPLHGVPIAIKDLFAFKAGVRHTFGSRVFAEREYVPDSDAPVVERLERAGAIVLGKTNTPEFGNRATTDNALVGTTVTPFAPGRTAGGTSGGSAAAVADGLAALAQGSDAGGSIRIPASCCGVYGLKPSFGRVPNGSRPNAFAEHTPFVQHGPLARTVADAAVMLDAVAGPHPDDPFTLPSPDESYLDAVDRPIDGMTVAYSPDLGTFVVDPEVRTAVEAVVEALADAGADVVEVDVTYDHSPEEIRDAWRTLFQVLMADVAMKIEVQHGMDLLEEHRDGIDPLFVRIVEAGRRYSAVEYKRADVVRTDVYDSIQAVLTAHDLLVTPTLAVPPFDADLVGPSEIDGQAVDPFIDWILSWPFNMTDHPAASLPAGFTGDGLPIGAQLVGRRFADGDVLAASAACERHNPWRDAYPPSP
ncbi:amidase [Halomarina halobia]|uniref:Amidase n=1 Tax=Halomarina halobia TaxID=3033386 RepID=A0ABD6ADI6_9EURY|nr:amidase family protein [Halomarina sp. PSR21]